MRANLSADSTIQAMGQRSGTNVEPNDKLDGCSMKDQSSVPERRHVDRQNDQSSFGLKRYLNDANPFDKFALGQDTSVAPRNRKRAMKGYIEAWDVQFENATRKDEEEERKV